jgi:flagellar biosynthesis protein FlhF
MEPRRFRANSMLDALAQVKRELGRDAVILQTRTVKSGGLCGIGAKTCVEITATTDSRATTTQHAHESASAASGQAKGDWGAPAAAQHVASDAAPAASDPLVDVAVLREIQEIRTMVQGLMSGSRLIDPPNVPSALLQHYTSLIQQNVASELAQIICRCAHDALRGDVSLPSGNGPPSAIASRRSVEAELLRVIASMIPATQPLALRRDGRPTIVALVGPTGVGKTTTLAKLAAQMRLREQKKVGLINFDAYRLAAAEQLRVYAQIMKMPMASVAGPQELTGTLDQMKDCDLVLIDTAGRSQRDEVRIAELRRFLHAAAPDQVHLVLSSTSHEDTIREAIAVFRSLGAEHLIFTKLDEAVGFGVILNVLTDVDMRLSYLTKGQSVPEDIEVGNGRRVAKLILGIRPDPDRARSPSGAPGDAPSDELSAGAPRANIA